MKVTIALLATAILGGTLLAAAAQSAPPDVTNSPRNDLADNNISPLTHCLDAVTQQPREKMSAPVGADANTSSSGAVNASGTPPGNISNHANQNIGTTGNATSGPASRGTATGLSPC